MHHGMNLKVIYIIYTLLCLATNTHKFITNERSIYRVANLPFNIEYDLKFQMVILACLLSKITASGVGY